MFARSPIIREIEVKSIFSKSNLPVCEYSVNPYVGCTHGCKYCYACFMKRFTVHAEPWGTFLDVKVWPEIKNPEKYAGKCPCPYFRHGAGQRSGNGRGAGS